MENGPGFHGAATGQLNSHFNDPTENYKNPFSHSYLQNSIYLLLNTAKI